MFSADISLDCNYARYCLTAFPRHLTGAVVICYMFKKLGEIINNEPFLKYKVTTKTGELMLLVNYM